MKLTGLSTFSSRTLLAAFIGTLGVIAAPRESALANDIAFSEAVRDTDYVAAGVGGMRNSTTASINLTGVSGTVNKAYLYWHGPSNVDNPLANANIRFAGRNITGVSLGLSDDNCWGFLNSAAYRADVTPIVKAERNGSYTLSQFLKQGTNINANGASLLVFFNDTNPDNNRDIVLFEGNDSNAPNPHDELGWNISLPDIRYMPTNFNTSNVLVQLHISDGQTWEDDAVVVNDFIIQARGAGFQGSTVPSNNNGPENNGSLWDIKTWDLTPLFNIGTNALRLIHNYIGRGDGTPRGDCVSLVVAVVNLPVGSAPPPPPPPPANLAPVITGTPVITVYTPEPLTVTALATDANGDPLTYTIAIDGTPVQAGDIPAGTPTTSGTLSVTNAFSLGQHTIVFSADDGQLSGNFTTVVNVIDTNPPVLNLPPNITVPTDPGKTNAVVTYVVTATDDFPGVTVISLPPSGNAFPIGTTTVTATAVDTSGNRTQGTFTITVTDSLPPYIFCPPDIIRATDPGTNNAVVHYTIPASDNLPGLTLACTPVSGSAFPIGITAVNCTARDAAGNTSTCMFTVTIMDTEPPVITTPTNLIVIAATGQCSSVVDYVVTVHDNAPGATVTCLPPSGSVFSLGVTPVVCSAMDAALNKSTNSFTVTVLDKEKPVLSLPANITVPTDPGKITGTVNFSVTATDNCSVPTVSTRPDPGSFPIGTTVVTSTATDSSGNTQTGTFTVTVVDTEPPVITTPTNMILVADIGQCSAVVNFTVTVRDNIPGVTVVCTPPSGSVFPKGTTTVVCIATDVAGNRTTNSFLVTIVDTQKPVLNLPASISVVIPPAQTTTVVSFNVTATDNCSIPTVVSTPPSGSSFPVGVTVVTNVATDAEGNTTTGTFTVTVRNDTTGDTVPPVITVPTNMVVGTDINQCSAVVNYTVTVTDNVPGATVVCNPPSGSAFPKSVTTVTCVATDVAGNQSSASFSVTVVDTQKPVLNLPANISIPIPPSQSNAVVTFTVTATDNCSVPTVISTPPSGSTFPVGITVITNVATDADGNTITGTFTVTIVARPNEGGDTVPPVITVPTNMIVATDLNLCSAVVNYTVTVTDNLPGATVVCNPPSGSVFPKGVTAVVCVATDLAGNQSSASFTVTVVDTQKPVLNLPANISVVIPPAQTSTFVSFNVTATDNCSVPTVVSTPPSGSSFPVGVTVVTNIATDADGNTTTGTFTVTVRNDTTGDTVPPVITVPTNMIVGTDINQCSAVVNYTVTVTDNRPGATVVCNPPSGSTFPKGVTPVTCVATDVAGNQSSASFIVTVVDTQKPVLNLPTPITVTIASNQTSAVVNFNVTATDNCSVPTVISTPPSGSTFPIGVTTVTNIATDSAGNTTVGTFTVTVRQDTGGDNEPPVIVSVTPSKTCLWPPNHKMVPITVTVKATDNSGKKVTARIVSVTSNEPENDLGDGNTERDWNITGALKVNLRAERSGLLTDRLYTITVEVTDAAGNISYGTTTVCVSHDQSNKKKTAATKRR